MSASFPPPFPATPQGPYAPGNAGDALREATARQAAERFFKKYTVFTGRASRSEYWWWTLIAFVINVVINLLARAIGFFLIIEILWALAIIVPGIALACRRLHDTGRSGWWQLLALIPCVGWIILIVWLATPPKPEGDRYNNA
jgi:uncharacterized membrane protein YhaH (DUF805 family)